MARVRQPTRTVLICEPDEHILCSCKVCKQQKPAKMELFPYCSVACRRKDSKG